METIMAKNNLRLNGSVEMLANAMHKVFSEAVEGAVEPLREDLASVRKDVANVRETMATREDINTSNNNMQAQFAEQEKKIGKMLAKS